ncbi:MAG: MBL fold metallo-hydrolase [Gemmatimonadaceae bacterium]
MVAGVLAIVLLLLRAANAPAQSTDRNASPSHTSSRDSLVPASLSADSATRAALASRLPRERFDTVRAFPLRALAPGAYAVMGDTGMGAEGRSNAGFIVGNDGVIVVDALASPGQAEVLLRTIRTVTSLPVRWVILTHHHPDHTFGAIVFKRQGATIIAHPDRRTLVSADGDDALASAWTGVMGLRQMQGFAFADVPDVSITHDTTFVLGGRTLTLIHPGTPHTAGDLMVWLPADRVLYSGDVLVEDGVTMVVDGNSTDLLGALDRITALDPHAVMPGHGDIPADPAALASLTRCYILGLRETMRTDVEQGVRMGTALESLPPADRDRPVSRHSRMRRNAVRVYTEMEHQFMEGTTTPAALSAEAKERAQCP